MKSYLKLNITYGRDFLIPSEHATTFLKLLKDIIITKTEYKDGNYIAHLVSLEDRESILRMSYVELLNGDMLNPESQWHDLMNRCDVAEQTLAKHAHIIKAANELNPNETEESIPI